MCCCVCLGWRGGWHRERGRDRGAAHSPSHGAWVLGGSSNKPSSRGQGTLPSPRSPFSSALSNGVGGAVIPTGGGAGSGRCWGQATCPHLPHCTPGLLPSVGGCTGCPPQRAVVTIPGTQVQRPKGAVTWAAGSGALASHCAAPCLGFPVCTARRLWTAVRVPWGDAWKEDPQVSPWQTSLSVAIWTPPWRGWPRQTRLPAKPQALSAPLPSHVASLEARGHPDLTGAQG